MSKPEKKRSSKIISTVCTVLTVIIAALALAIIVNMIICRVQKRPVSFFGTSFAIVQTDSMEPEIMTGDLILFKSVDYEELKQGEIIVFRAGDGFGDKMKGQNIVHRIIEITPNGLTTKGDNNAGPDRDMVTADNLIGKCTSHSTAWGKIFTFLGKYGIIFLIAAVALPIIISQILKIIKLSKAKDGAEGETSKPFPENSVTENGVQPTSEANSDGERPPVETNSPPNADGNNSKA